MSLGTELKTISKDILADIEGIAKTVVQKLQPIFDAVFAAEAATLAQAAVSGSLSGVGTKMLSIGAAALSQAETQGVVAAGEATLSDITTVLDNAVKNNATLATSTVGVVAVPGTAAAPAA